MCFNRRRNTFTLGEFQNTINPVVARIRTELRNRQPVDVFARDPFKVQSFNFRYAERPSNQDFQNYRSSNFSLHSSQSRTLSTCPFQTYFHNYGFNHTRHDENAAQAGESARLRGRQYEEPSAAAGTAANLSGQPTSGPHYAASTNALQAHAQRQQRPLKYPSYAAAVAAESCCANEPQLSAHTEVRNAAVRNGSSGRYNASATSVPAMRQLSAAKSERLPEWFCGNEKGISPADAAARARQAARGSSKAMAAAVGTVGKAGGGGVAAYKNNNNNSNSSNNKGSAGCSKTNGGKVTVQQLSTCAIGGSAKPTQPVRPLGSSWRSYATSVEQGSNRTRICVSSPMLCKKTNHASGAHQTQQQSQRRAAPATVASVVNRSGQKAAPVRTLVQRCNSCEISININRNSQTKQPNKQENVIIKIESAAPFKVISNAGGCGTSKAAASNMRSKRLNDLMSRKPNVNVPPSKLNITPKPSTGTIQMNSWQSKHFIGSAASSSSINQRVLNCERFVENEGERLRQRAAANACKAQDIGHVLGTKPAKIVPWVQSSIIPQPQRAQPTATAASACDASTSQRLKSLNSRCLMNLHQLRASLDAGATTTDKKSSARQPAPLKRSATAPQRMGCSSAPTLLARQSSSSTFTLPTRNNFSTAARSISPPTSSYCRRGSNPSLLSWK